MEDRNTFSQPLTLIECIRSLQKGLQMLASDEACGGKPPKKTIAHTSTLSKAWELCPGSLPQFVSTGHLTQWQVALW